MGTVLEAALKITDYSPQFRFILKQKLRKKGFVDIEIDAVLDKLEEACILDDRRLAFLYASELVRNKLYGTRMVAAKLTEKGICKEIISDAVDNAYKENITEYETCIKYMTKNNLFEAGLSKETIYRKLSSRGFSNSVISNAMSNHGG